MDFDDGANVQFNSTSRRGDEFGGGAVLPFLQRNNIECIFRAHQCHRDGIVAYLYGKDHPVCYTVFSIPEYEDGLNNRGGVFVFIEGEMNVVYFEKRLRKGKVMDSTFEIIRKSSKETHENLLNLGKEIIRIMNGNK